MNIQKTFSAALKIQKQYFTSGRREIANENLITMEIAGSFGTIICLIFFFIAPIIIPSWSVTKEYLCALPILTATFAFACYYRRRKKEINPHVVEIASAFFYILLLLDFIALSVFPYPNTPQIFISLCFMFMPVLTIQRPTVLIGIMFGSESLFLFLAFQLKTQFAIENDIFNTFVAMMFAIIIIIITNRLRCRNFLAKVKLEKLSQTDALTGLLNKNSFEEYCEFYLTENNTQNACTLLILDLDDFKQVNDNYGHPFGDVLLSEVGKALKKSFRQTDAVGRIGGDEFAVLIQGIADLTVIENKCGEIQECLASLNIEDIPFPAACSIGKAIPHHKNTTYKELFSSADSELYEMKRKKKS